MINKDILNGIANALHDNFTNHDIYIDNIKQGFNSPCFFIRALSFSNQKYIDKRYKYSNSFVVQYFPSNKVQEKSSCYDVGESLYNVLEFISCGTGSTIRAYDMHFEVIDDILMFYVNYNCFVIKNVSDEDSMNSIESHATEINES